MKFYAVAKGFRTGVFTNWDDASKQIDGFSSPVYKRTPSFKDAVEFIHDFDMAQQNLSESTSPNIDAIIEVAGSSKYSKDRTLHLVASYTLSPTDMTIAPLKQFITIDLNYYSENRSLAELSATIYAVQKAIDLGLKNIQINYTTEKVKRLANKSWRPSNKEDMRYANKMHNLQRSINIIFKKSNSDQLKLETESQIG